MDLLTLLMAVKLAPKPLKADVIEGVADWLDDHPEATTTVEDGSITEAKLASALKAKINNMSGLTDDIKQALLECFAHVAWTDAHGQEYLDALEGALYPSGPTPATLSSITAVYTQSGTVYDTDTLDSLKSDLVVTAVYSDSTTQTVASTDYTLSGTLTEGTSTITVSYGGKTTTFTVTVTKEPNWVTDDLEFLLDATQYKPKGVTAYNQITDLSGNNVIITFGSYNHIVFEDTYVSEATRGQIKINSAEFVAKLLSGFTIEVAFQNRYYTSGDTSQPTDGGTGRIASFINGKGMINADARMQLPDSATYYGTATDLTTAVHTVTVTYDGTTLKEYIDGTQTYSASHTIDLSTATFLEFFGNMGYSSITACSWNSVRVYSKVLTATEVSDNRAFDVVKYGSINISM